MRPASVGRRQDPTLPLLLLFAEPLQREGLVRWLEQPPAAGRVVSDAGAGIPAETGPVRLVIWALDGAPASDTLTAELRALQERWQPAPVLLLLPGRHAYPTDLLLTLPVAAGFAGLAGTLFPVFRVSGSTMALQMAAALLVGLVAAAWPAWKMSRIDIVAGLRHVA